MILADILMWFLIIVGLLLAFNSYWLAAYALFPAMVERSRTAYTRPVRSVLLGAILLVPFMVLGIALAAVAHPVAKLLGVSILATPVLLGLLGSAGLSQRIGVGLASGVDAGQPWRQVLRGGTVLSLLFLFPFLGWFGVLPLTLISGFGAIALSWKARASPSGIAVPSP